MSALIYFLKIYIEDMSLSSIYLGFDLKNSIGRNLGDNNSSEAGKSSRLVLILLDGSASKFAIRSINEISPQIVDGSTMKTYQIRNPHVD